MTSDYLYEKSNAYFYKIFKVILNIQNEFI